MATLQLTTLDGVLYVDTGTGAEDGHVTFDLCRDDGKNMCIVIPRWKFDDIMAWVKTGK